MLLGIASWALEAAGVVHTIARAKGCDLIANGVDDPRGVPPEDPRSRLRLCACPHLRIDRIDRDRLDDYAQIEGPRRWLRHLDIDEARPRAGRQGMEEANGTHEEFLSWERLP